MDVWVRRFGPEEAVSPLVDAPPGVADVLLLCERVQEDLGGSQPHHGEEEEDECWPWVHVDLLELYWSLTGPLD